MVFVGTCPWAVLGGVANVKCKDTPRGCPDPCGRPWDGGGHANVKCKDTPRGCPDPEIVSLPALDCNLIILQPMQRMKRSAATLLTYHHHLSSDTQGDFIRSLGPQV